MPQEWLLPVVGIPTTTPNGGMRNSGRPSDRPPGDTQRRVLPGRRRPSPGVIGSAPRRAVEGRPRATDPARRRGLTARRGHRTHVLDARSKSAFGSLIWPSETTSRRNRPLTSQSSWYADLAVERRHPAHVVRAVHAAQAGQPLTLMLYDVGDALVQAEAGHRADVLVEVVLRLPAAQRRSRCSWRAAWPDARRAARWARRSRPGPPRCADRSGTAALSPAAHTSRQALDLHRGVAHDAAALGPAAGRTRPAPGWP